MVRPTCPYGLGRYRPALRTSPRRNGRRHGADHRDQTARRITSSLRDVLDGLARVAVDATPASLTGSASGSVNYLINIVDARKPAQ